MLAAFAALLYGLEDLISEIRSTRFRFAASEQFVYGMIVLGALGAGAWTVNVALDEVVDPADGRLPNSQLIRLSADQYHNFSELVSRASSHCDALVTIPGMNSFHVWSGVPHPNGFIVSAAMALFDAPTQQRLRERFVAVSRPCVIFNPGLERWSARYRRMRAHEPFIDMVHDELVTVYSRDGYEIRIPRAQMRAWR